MCLLLYLFCTFYVCFVLLPSLQLTWCVFCSWWWGSGYHWEDSPRLTKPIWKCQWSWLLLISHLWIHPQIARLTKFESESHKDRQRRLQDVNNETLKVIDTCSQIKVIQQSWKTSMSGWWQKAQLVWIWTQHQLSRILTSWWHHQWANFFGRF